MYAEEEIYIHMKCIHTHTHTTHNTLFICVAVWEKDVEGAGLVKSEVLF